MSLLLVDVSVVSKCLDNRHLLNPLFLLGLHSVLMMKTYLRLLSFAKPIEKFAIPFAYTSVLAVFFNTLNFALLSPLISVLFNAGNTAHISHKPTSFFHFIDFFNYYAYQASRHYGAYHALALACLLILVSVLLGNIFRYMSQRSLENLGIHALANFRKKIFNNIMDLDLAYFNNERKGSIISKLTSDVQVVQFSITSALQLLCKEPLHLVAYLLTLFMISYKLTLFVLLVVPIAALMISFIAKRLKRTALEAQKSYGNLVHHLDEAILGIKIIKSFNAEKWIKDKFNAVNQQYAKYIRSMVKRQQLAAPVSELMSAITVTVIVLYGGSLVLNNHLELTPDNFIVYIFICARMIQPAKAISGSITHIASGIAAGTRILRLIDEKANIVDKPNAVSMIDFSREICLEKVSFAYQEKPILNQIDLIIPKGKTVALVGPSGAGKSTLMDLLPRFIEPQSGRILFDGKDIRFIKKECLRSLMGIVHQETTLFNDSIFNNIAFGKPEASQEQVMAAARSAYAHDFIIKLKNGYQMCIGDRGVKLSGGQRQRICIARAILHNPPILLLDEATSSLDTESEQLVQLALNNLMQHRTSLIIAHRLSTIQNADIIVVLEQGTIVEQGTHQELIAHKGLYQRLAKFN